MKTFNIYLDIFLNWQNLLDIVLIAAGLFFLYRTLLRLGTWKILVGMLAAFAVFIVANALNLEGIEWIFKNVSQVALLGLIIIFQPEIRKIFEKIVSLTFGKGYKNESETISIVADSLWSLAGQKQGAIIVFPGKEQIEDKISGGYDLNAQPSLPLITSIFDSSSPGHDGAVIIIEDIVTRFGVRLPMSSSARLSEEYGTRHHAAMGMAEETDSLVLLVSEERGHVSAFSKGKMRRLNTRDEIIDEIERHISSFDIKQMAQKVSMSRRTSLQIAASVLVAVAFWSTLILGQKQVVERNLHIPIEYTSPSEGLVFMGSRTNELVVYAAGPKSAMNDFMLSDPKAVIDLSRMAAGEQKILISEANIRRPKDVTLLDINPGLLEINLFKNVKKMMPITPQLIGKLPANLKLKRVEIVPGELEVFAPSSHEDKKSLSIFTSPIYLSSITGNSTIMSKIIAPPSVQPVEKRWPDVEVIITVE